MARNIQSAHTTNSAIASFDSIFSSGTSVVTSDIVWLVEQTITLPDGTTTTALVPQVYLRVRPGDLNDNGALLAGADVHLNLSGDLVNTGSVEVTEGQTFKQGGLNVSLSGGVVDVATATYGAVKRGSEVEDDRLKGLYAAQAGQTLFSPGAGKGTTGLSQLGDTGQQFKDLGKAVQTQGQSVADAKAQGEGGNGINLRIGIGASRSSSQMDYTETTVQGSRIASEGDVAIVARSGDLSVTGSAIEGDNVALAAAQDLILQSAQESHAMTARDKASSGEIGITIGTEAGMGVYVSAHASKGKGDGSGTTHAETTVSAGNTLTLISGRDTTLEGAQASGETVIANVGRDLTLISQQDTNDYERKDQAGGIDVAVGVGGGSASGYYNQSKIDSTYTSVNEQTGIQAGAGGFDITVGGHTDLVGAAIASTADPSKNRLSTNTLSASDLQNEAKFKASSFGVSASSSGGSTGNLIANGIGAGMSLAAGQKESESSTTRAGISDGVIDIRSGDDSALASIDRSITELQQSGLNEIFDEQQVNERMEMGQVAGQVGMTAAGDLADKMGWKEGSKEKVILHGVVGAAIAALSGGDALQGLAGAAASQLATTAMQTYLRDNEINPDSALGKTLMQLGSAAVGAALGGSSGAATALYGEKFNRQLHPNEAALIDQFAEDFARHLNEGDEPTPEQIAGAKQRLIAQTLYQVDSTWAGRLEDDPVASGFLRGLAQHYDGLETGGGGLFDARGTAAYDQSWVNAQYLPQTREFYDAITASGADPRVRISYLAMADAAGDPSLANAPTATFEQLSDTIRQLRATATNSYEANATNAARLGLLTHGQANGVMTPGTALGDKTLMEGGLQAYLEGLPMEGGSPSAGVRAPTGRTDVTGNSTQHGVTGKFTDKQLQGAADAIHSALPEGRARNQSVTTVSVTQDGTVFVSLTGRLPTKAQRDKAYEIFGQNVVFVPGGVKSAGHHSEVRGINAMGNGSAGSTQTSSHYACSGCAARQQETGVRNTTGTAEHNDGKITRPLDPSDSRLRPAPKSSDSSPGD